MSSSSLISASASLFLAPRLDIYGTAYLRILTAVLWSAFTILAVVAIRKSDVIAHRRWMMRSYAFTYMGLSLLFYNALGTMLDLDLAYRYPAVAWLTFLTNVLFVEILLWRRAPRQWPGSAALACSATTGCAAGVVRDYGMSERREQAPDDSREAHAASGAA